MPEIRYEPDARGYQFGVETIIVRDEPPEDDYY
jgi:hypothetical protein